jgi:hypothetical protein
MVIHAVDYSRKDGVFATSELNFFLGKNFLVTFHEAAAQRAADGGALLEEHMFTSPARRIGGAHAVGRHRGELQAGAGRTLVRDRGAGGAVLREAVPRMLNKIIQSRRR